MSSPHAHSFSLAALERKLRNVTSTMQSIQEVSQWAIHHRKQAKTVVSAWYKELQKGSRIYIYSDCHTAPLSRNVGPRGEAQFRWALFHLKPRAWSP